MVISITIDTKELNKFLDKLPETLETGIGNSAFDLAKITAKEIRTQLLAQQKIAPRDKLASRIEARKISKKESGVFLPIKAHFLDTMTPHWVALKRGRKITEWVKKYYGRMVKAGRSRVFRGPRGGILFNEQKKSYLWVTPDPFVNTGFQRARRQFETVLKRNVRMALEEASR